MPTNMYDVRELKIIDEFIYVLFGGLEELLKMGYIDGFDDLPPSLMNYVVDHDKSIVQRYYRRSLISVVRIPTDLEKYDFDILAK